MALELDLEEESPFDRLFELADRAIAGRLRNDQVAQVLGGMVGGWLGRVMQQSGIPMPGLPGATPRPPGNPRVAPRAAPPDPALEAKRIARITLGFGETEPITAEIVKERKRALARVFHPDTGKGGSVEHMQRINQAADLLLQGL